MTKSELVDEPVPTEHSHEFVEDDMLDWPSMKHGAAAMNCLGIVHKLKNQQPGVYTPHSYENLLKIAQIHAMLAVAAAIRDR